MFLACTFRVPWLYILIGCLAFKRLNSERVFNMNDCHTPDKNPGSCVLAKECKSLLDYLYVTKVTSEIKEQLKGYQCGFHGKEVKVCCPNTTISLQNNAHNKTHKNINFLPKNCGHAERSKLIGGNKAELFEVPWIALLSYKTQHGTRFKCAGSVISDRYVLTAAHCLSNTNNFELVGVRCGEQNLDTEIDCDELTTYKICADPVQDMAIEEIISHPDYNSKSYANDIGLIRLAAPLNISVENVQPICLPTNSNLKETPKWLTATSWGLADTMVPDLQRGRMEVASQENCKKTYEPFRIQINDQQLCANHKMRQDWCGGDSGSAFYADRLVENDIRSVQYGIVSFGPRSCADISVPFVYTRTEPYIDWILDNLKP